MSERRSGRDARRHGRARARGLKLYVVAGVVLLSGIAVYGLSTIQSSAVQGDIGPAPNVTLRTDAGDVPLASARGKILVLYFSFPG